MDLDEIVSLVMEELKKEESSCNINLIPTGVSNRHMHVSESDFHTLFGNDAKLTNKKDLSQMGQFASNELVNLIGPKGIIENVRILGPYRDKSQVEILNSDSFKLGVNVPVRESGDLDGSSNIIVTGNNGCIKLFSKMIVAKRHIHMSTEDSNKFNLKNGDIVRVKVNGERGGILNNVVIRVSQMFRLDFHIDMDEANCFGLKNGDKVELIK